VRHGNPNVAVDSAEPYTAQPIEDATSVLCPFLPTAATQSCVASLNVTEHRAGRPEVNFRRSASCHTILPTGHALICALVDRQSQKSQVNQGILPERRLGQITIELEGGRRLSAAKGQREYPDASH